MSQQINLFNPVFLKQKKYFSARTMLQALGLVLLGLVAIYGLARYQTGTLQAALADSDIRLKAQRGQLAKLAAEFSPAGRSKLLEEDVARVEARLQSRLELLAAVTSGISANLEGCSGYMAAFARQAMNGVWLTGFTLAANGELSIKGRVLNADLVPAYLQALNREAVMRGRSVAELTLAARELPADPAPGASPADKPAADKPAAGKPQAPMRFVEFSVNLARRAGQPAGAAK